jgi:hypothetical protein
MDSTVLFVNTRADPRDGGGTRASESEITQTTTVGESDVESIQVSSTDQVLKRDRFHCCKSHTRLQMVW